MPTYEKASKEVTAMARELMQEFETHQPLIEHEVEIDFLFAFGSRDDDGNLIGDAITKNGQRCYGLARKIPLKDRAKGNGDAEIMLDHEWWEQVGPDERRAVLDHELHHLAVKVDKSGAPKRDDLGRPIIKLRKHDVEIGWFAIIAARHGNMSIEQQQARKVFDAFGQAFWPDLVPLVPAERRMSMLDVSAPAVPESIKGRVKVKG